MLFNPETCYKSFSIKKKLDFMTIILCPKFNQHNLSGPSSGGMFLLETKKQKKQKAKKRGFIFAWNSRLLCPCIICVLESTERSSTGGQIRVKRNYKLFKFPRTNGVYSQRIYIKIPSEIIISNAVKIDSFLGKIELILSLYYITLFTRQFSQHEWCRSLHCDSLLRTHL